MIAGNKKVTKNGENLKKRQFWTAPSQFNNRNSVSSSSSSEIFGAVHTTAWCFHLIIWFYIIHSSSRFCTDVSHKNNRSEFSDSGVQYCKIENWEPWRPVWTRHHRDHRWTQHERQRSTRLAEYDIPGTMAWQETLSSPCHWTNCYCNSMAQTTAEVKICTQSQLHHITSFIPYPANVAHLAADRNLHSVLMLHSHHHYHHRYSTHNYTLKLLTLLQEEIIHLIKSI